MGATEAVARPQSGRIRRRSPITVGGTVTSFC
jgi:hypothetical protein